MASSEDFEAIFGLKMDGRGHNYDLTNLDLTGRGWRDREGVGGRVFTICSTIPGSGMV